MVIYYCEETINKRREPRGMDNYKKIIETCAAQEDKYVFESFTRKDAMELGRLIAENARRTYGTGIAVGVAVNGLKVFQYVDEGATIHNAEWLDRKIATVTQFHKSSLRVWAEFEDAGITLEGERLNPYQFALCGGGFPLTVRGAGVIGVIAASGLPHLDDHQVLIDALEEFIR